MSGRHFEFVSGILLGLALGVCLAGCLFLVLGAS